jgi:hypothetical protein
MKTSDESRIGDVLLKMGTISEAQLADAMNRQRAGDARPLGMLLLELGYAEARDVQLALLRQQALRGRITCEEGLRLLEEAREGTERMGSSLSELTTAAEELGGKR